MSLRETAFTAAQPHLDEMCGDIGYDTESMPIDEWPAAVELVEAVLAVAAQRVVVGVDPCPVYADGAHRCECRRNR